MHETASSIVAFFLSPSNWIVLLLIAGYFLRKSSQRKYCRIFALFIFLLFSNKWIINWYAKKWQPLPVIISNGASYNCGIIPGGFASPDTDGNGYFNATCDRFIQVVKLYKTGAITHILINGGNGKTDDKNFREAAWVKGELKSVGIPDSVIYIEDHSTNTFENAIFAKKILDSVHLKPPYVLITSAQHIPRASLLFKNAGITTIAFPCNYIQGRGTFGFSDLLPKFSVLSDWNSYLKEAAGYIFYYIKGNKR